jgi:pimeloyl-ACP methyl ester carboxylesterase
VHSLRKILKNALKVVLIIAAIIVLFLAISFVNHKIRSSNEKDLLTPLGELVEVNGHNMSIYVEGDGDKTLVFMSGGGTCSPILDFKSLYSLLSDDYKIVVVEKFGYGFSDIVDENRDIDTILSETRMALDKAGIESPYVLCPHSLSGVEALYWAQKYPQEVEAIVGLDMAVPGYYDEMKISIPTVKLGHYGAVLGITRFIPSLAESDAIKFGTLSEKEKEIYRAVFYQKTATVTMINEVKAVKDNANVVKENGIPQVPMLLFISNGSGGTNFTEEMWRSIPKEYISGHDNASYIELDCPHYVHDYEYEEISR